MAIPATKKTAPPTGLQEALDLLGVLVKQSVLTAEQADKVRRAQKVNDLSAEQALIPRTTRALRPGTPNECVRSRG